jgi:hypothetical protein
VRQINDWRLNAFFISVLSVYLHKVLRSIILMRLRLQLLPMAFPGQWQHQKIIQKNFASPVLQ